MLVVHSFSKSYHAQQVLSVDALSLPAGVHLVKGGNGAGKTTFFKCLAGLAPFRGTISLSGVSLTEKPVAYRYKVNFGEAEPLFPDFLTARDLIGFYAKTKKATEEQKKHLCSHFGVHWFYEKPCGTYSSGMLKKLSLVLAFLGTPEMIILDEPLITLDEETRGQLFAIINAKSDVIFLMSSHHAIDSGSLTIANTFTVNNKTLLRE
jgi:ABC-2 type transport system ATP-binding protein